jgi:hypothetical protein
VAWKLLEKLSLCATEQPTDQSAIDTSWAGSQLRKQRKQSIAAEDVATKLQVVSGADSPLPDVHV